MSDALRDFLRGVLVLPVDEQREALIPGYRFAYEAYTSDLDLNTASFADDYVFRMAGTRRIPGFPDELHGAAGYKREQSRMLEDLNVERIELDDVRPLGDGRVVSLYRFVIRTGAGTIDQQALDLHEFRDGQLLRQTVWFDRDEGLRELGLEA